MVSTKKNRIRKISQDTIYTFIGIMFPAEFLGDSKYSVDIINIIIKIMLINMNTFICLLLRLFLFIKEDFLCIFGNVNKEIPEIFSAYYQIIF